MIIYLLIIFEHWIQTYKQKIIFHTINPSFLKKAFN